MMAMADREAYPFDIEDLVRVKSEHIHTVFPGHNHKENKYCRFDLLTLSKG